MITGIHDTTCCKILILTMCKHWNINLCCKSHSLSCYSCIHNRSSILTYSYRTCLFKILKICQILSILTCSYSCYRKYIDISNLFCLISDILYHLYTIYNRLSVWHRAYSCKTASCCCSCTCSYSFLMFKAWFPEMHMNVYKTWHDKTGFIIYYAICGIINIFSNLFNYTICYKNILNFVCITCRINNSTILYQHFHNQFSP